MTSEELAAIRSDSAAGPFHLNAGQCAALLAEVDRLRNEVACHMASAQPMARAYGEARNEVLRLTEMLEAKGVAVEHEGWCLCHVLPSAKCTCGVTGAQPEIARLRAALGAAKLRDHGGDAPTWVMEHNAAIDRALRGEA